MFLWYFLLYLGSLWGEGYTAPMGSVRVPDGTKFHGVGTQSVFEPQYQTKKSNQVVKRSYKRALKRMQLHGWTWYRGRLISNITPVPAQDAPIRSFNVEKPKTLRRSRLSCFSWNTGGLSGHSWDLFQAWALEQSLDVILLQETHWTQTLEWTQTKYHCIHCGSGDRTGGLLCMVARTLCTEHDISWNDVVPGRVLHVRIHGHSNSIDILNVYQYVGVSANEEKRQLLWDALQTTIHKFPKRNILILGGDFNSSLQQRSRSVGSGTFAYEGKRTKGSTHSDDEVLHNLLKSLDLIALNTWNLDLSATYEHGLHRSRIDFLCCKRLHNDSTAREVHLLHQFPLLHDAGSRHIPLMTSLPRHWHHMTSAPKPGWGRKQRMELHQRWSHDSDFADMLGQQLNAQLSQFTAPQLYQDLQPLHHTMETFSTSHTQTTLTTDTTPIYIHALGPCRQLHWHLEQLRHFVTISLQSCFTSWFHVIKKDAIRKQLRLGAITARKQRVNQVLRHALDAERAHDHFRLYEAIRKLSPKTTYSRAILRSEHGDLLNPSDSADVLQAWFQDLYRDDGPSLSSEPFEWPFQKAALVQQLRNLPGSKALAPDCGPATYWKEAADTLATLIQPCCDAWSFDGRFPDSWSGGHLTFLNKPGKRGHSPSELRPIALLEPTGKIAMGMLAQGILSEALPLLCQLPQLAYLPNRGCTEAIQLMTNHCKDVRDLLQLHQYGIHRRAAGTDPPSLIGGITISLDLTKAFDMVPRAKLFDSLVLCGISAPLHSLLRSIYSQTSFSFNHRGHSRTFETLRGIRQGCKAAPILWCCYAALILTRAAESMSWTWVMEHILMYADDILIYHIVHHQHDVPVFLKQVGQLFDILESHGMKINMTKTVAICRLLGSKIHTIQKQWMKRTLQGLFLLIPRANGSCTWLRIVSNVTYLGVTLNYNNFELLTMRARIAAGNRAQAQLHRWLHCDTGFSAKQKLKIWRQCILSCFNYGLFAVGFTSHTLNLYYKSCMRHLRRIYKEPVFVERISHLDFLEKHRLQHPLVLLHGLGLKLYGKAVLRHNTLDPHDFLRRLNLTALCDNLNFLYNSLTTLSNTPSTLNFYFHCDRCARTFETQAALRRHHTLHHEQRGGLHKTATEADSLHGLPTCVKCHARFTTWYNFRYHVEYVCTVSTEAEDLLLANHEHRLRVAELVQLATSSDLQAIAARVDLCAYFTQKCALCGCVCFSARGFLQHCGTSHSTLFQQHGPFHDRLIGPETTSSPCQLCGQMFQQTHQCMILRQIAMLLTQDALTDSTAHRATLVPPVPEATWPCPHCQQVYTTRHGLQQHLKRYHTAMEVQNPMGVHPDAHLHDMIAQAVLKADCDALLTNPEILKVLSLRCINCKVDFTRKQDLSRHLRTHHSMDREPCTTDAKVLDELLRPAKHCFCTPMKTQRHICLPFMQFALARRKHLAAEQELESRHSLTASAPPPFQAEEEHTDADEPTSMPLVFLPTHLPLRNQVSVVELMSMVLHFGQLDVFATSKQLRRELTLACQICAEAFSDFDTLQQHLRECHLTDIAASERHFDLLHWMIFKDNGCICNPGVPWNTMPHYCVAITQAAIIHSRLSSEPLVPWPFKAADIVATLRTILPNQVLVTTAYALITRQFSHLAADETLRTILSHTCLICREDIMEVNFEDHYEERHRRDLGRGPELIREQLRATCWPMMQDDNFAQHLACLLALPVWHRSFELTSVWPTVQQVLGKQHLRNLAMSQLIVPYSVLEDSNAFQIITGLQLLDDSWLANQLPYTCLMCQKLFFAASNLIRHLLDHHDAHDHATQEAHDILVQIGRVPCYFCGLTTHPVEQGYRCAPALNVAACITHGHRSQGRNGSALGQPFDPRPDSAVGLDTNSHEGGPAQWHQTPKRPSDQHQIQGQSGTDDTTAAPNVDPTGTTPRGLLEHFDARAPIYSSHVSWTGLNFARASSAEPTMAQADRQGDHPSTPSCTSHGESPVCQVGETQRLKTGRLSLARLPEISHPERGNEVPLPEMGSQEGAAGSDQTACSHLGGDLESGQRDCDIDGGPDGHAPLPQPDQAAEGSGERSTGVPMAVDAQPTDQPGIMALSAQIIISRSLATYSSAPETSVVDQESLGSDGAEIPGTMNLRAVRICSNATGNLCYANTFFQGMAWLALLCTALDASHWADGFALIDKLTIFTPCPLDLSVEPVFLRLLTGVWTLGALSSQQDLNEFAEAMLQLLRPTFLNGAWQTLPMFTGDAMDDTHLGTEKGLRFSALRLSLTSNTDAEIHLQKLVDVWHDFQGLCRLLHEASSGMCISIDRCCNETRQKLSNLILFDEIVKIPCYDSQQQSVKMINYAVCGLAFHLGEDLQSGHYRCGLFHKQKWLLYDDGKIPHQCAKLPSQILCETVYMWLVRTADTQP